MGKGKSKPFLKFHAVTFMYDTAPEPLLEDVSLHAVTGWTGVIGANGTGKTTLLKLAVGLLEPGNGSIDRPWDSFYCAQRTDTVPDRLAELIRTPSKSAQIIREQLGVEADWAEPDRWTTLSHGERKRSQIAVALWLEPSLLAVDEPTNHLDAAAREMITAALQSFNGIGLLVSHDRELLDTLCYQCISMEPPGLSLRHGGYTQAMSAINAEQDYLQKERTLKKQAYHKLEKEEARRRELAKQAKKRKSKRGLAKNDHDAREKIDRARVSGKDGVGGKLQRQMQGRLSRSRGDFERIHVKKQYKLGIRMPGSASKRNFLLELPAAALPLGRKGRLYFPELIVKPGDRIAVTGPNGSGKSTLIRHLVDKLQLSPGQFIYVPQEITERQSKEILAQVTCLPDGELGYLMTVISALGSRPQRLLESSTPSPGEMRKLMLALGMTRDPHIIIMDEPTNHIDLPSIRCLEQALQESPCGLVLVSHDNIFLQTLTQKQWSIAEDTDSPGTYILQIF